MEIVHDCESIKGNKTPHFGCTMEKQSPSTGLQGNASLLISARYISRYSSKAVAVPAAIAGSTVTIKILPRPISWKEARLTGYDL